MWKWDQIPGNKCCLSTNRTRSKSGEVVGTSVQTWAWTWSRTRCRRTASSRWWWWCDSFLPESPAGSGLSCCLCRARGISGKTHVWPSHNYHLTPMLLLGVDLCFCPADLNHVKFRDWRSDSPFPRPELRWRFPAPTEICWCSSPHPARLPPPPSYSPVQTERCQLNN